MGRVNALFRKAHRWQLTDRTFTIEELGKRQTLSYLGPLLGTLLTAYTNYYLHIMHLDQLNIHYENGVTRTRSSYPPSVQHTLYQHLI